MNFYFQQQNELKLILEKKIMEGVLLSKISENGQNNFCSTVQKNYFVSLTSTSRYDENSKVCDYSSFLDFQGLLYFFYTHFSCRSATSCPDISCYRPFEVRTWLLILKTKAHALP